MRWTAEAVEDLKRLALEGRSASAIAAAVGAASRNAVIGKANRIGIKLNGDGRASALRRTAAGTHRAQRPAISRPQFPNAVPALARQPQVIPGPTPGDGDARGAAWTFAEAEVGEMRRLRFEEIREFACRWPLGDPKSGEFAYCGLRPAQGRSYCAGHCRMAYRPPQARQSAGERQGFRALASSWRLA
ncbi:MAG TPA: GcrA family cell cycle regulator [Roseiarcus sp.]|nr:GcrA family cell cycle regulator [Roseiarcus sp.]